MLPGSPTPLELGMKGVRQELSRMGAGLSLTVAAAPMLVPAMAGAAAGGDTVTNRNVSIGAVNNRDQLTGRSFDRAMRDWLGG